MFEAFVDSASLCLKMWDVTINIAHVRELVFFLPRKKLSEALKRENKTNYENNTYKKGV